MLQSLNRAWACSDTGTMAFAGATTACCNPSIGRGPVLTTGSASVTNGAEVLQSLNRAWACSDVDAPLNPLVNVARCNPSIGRGPVLTSCPLLQRALL